VCVWEGECSSAEQWILILIRENVTFFFFWCHLSVQHTAWFLEVVFSAIHLLGIATHEVYIDGKNKKAQ